MGDLPPLNSNTAIVGPEGRPKPAFVLLINQLLSGSVASVLAKLNALLAGAPSGTPPIDVAGTYGAGVTISLADSGVTAGTYGDASHYAVVTVDDFGRVTDASEEPFAAGTIEVEQAGVSKVAAATKLNFASGATVTQNGADPSQADIAISGGGGGSSDFIAEVILSATAANIALTSIPATFKDLIIEMDAFNTSSDIETYAQFNSDTSSDYNYYLENRFGNSLNTGQSRARMGSSAAPADPFIAPSYMEIRGYADAAPKTYLYEGGYPGSGGFYERGFGSWQNNAVITDILIFPGSGSFGAGTRVRLYGRGG